MTAIPAVHHLSGEVAQGALIAVVGPNGAGKSTLFRGIVGMLKPLAGAIAREGSLPHDIGYLPQIGRHRPQLSDLGVRLRRHGPVAAHRPVRRHRQRLSARAIEQALATVGLTGFESRSIGTLSGGQMQRMLFARLLLQDARVIVLDEPFNAIDVKTSTDLVNLVRRWHGEKRTVLAALHDLHLVRDHFPETLLLAREKVAWGATAEVLTAGQSAEGAPHVRGLRRSGRGVRRMTPKWKPVFGSGHATK